MYKVKEEIQVSLMHVFDPKFCTASAVNLLIKPVKGSFKNSTPLNVIDAGGNLVFKAVKGDSFFMSTDRLILDAADSPVAQFCINQSSIASVKKKNEKEGGGLEVQVSEGIDNTFILALLVIHGEMRQWKMDGPKLLSPAGRAESDDVFCSAPPPSAKSPKLSVEFDIFVFNR